MVGLRIVKVLAEGEGLIAERVRGVEDKRNFLSTCPTMVPWCGH